MKKTYAPAEAEKMLPLLRSIGREVRRRAQEVERIHGRVAALYPTRHAHAEEIGRLESELSAQRRELRRARKELERLGCRLDEAAEARILIPGPNSDHVVDGFLERTRFEPAPALG